MTPATQITLRVTPPYGASFDAGGTTDAQGNATLTIPPAKAQEAGSYAIAALVGGAVQAQISATVGPDSIDVDLSEIESSVSAIATDGRESADIVVTLRDRYGNPLPDRPVTVISSRSTDRITALDRETRQDGAQHFSLATSQPGPISVRAIDLLSGKTIASTVSLDATDRPVGGVRAVAQQNDDRTSFYSTNRQFYGSVAGIDGLDHFDVTGPSEMQLGVEQNVTVRAVDKDGATVRDYLGTVLFDSTDPNAILPGRGTYVFKERDQGEKRFPLGLAFYTSGTQTLRAYDKELPEMKDDARNHFLTSIAGSIQGNQHGIQILSHKDGDTVNATRITIAGTGPRFANLIVTGGLEDAKGSSDGEGRFSIPMQLNDAYHEFTLRVRDDLNRNDSGDFHLILDNSPPAIGTITFAPEQPTVGDKVLVVVKSEATLQSAIILLTVDEETKTIVLTENATEPGTYQGFFDAPTPSAYQPTIRMTDAPGNAAEVRAAFTVKAKELPVVQNVRAEPQVNAVQLIWDPVNEPLSGYRVYIGDGPNNFLYSMDTGSATTKATVAGLSPEKVYTFAVTALQDDKESARKSDAVTEQPLGMKLAVTATAGGLTVQWSALSSNMPIETFLLTYGTDASALTEKRTINGKLRETTIRDLLGGVTYHLSLTPMTVTGDMLTDLTATGEGTPQGGEGFVIGPHDDIPFAPTTSDDAPILHPGAEEEVPPATPQSGAPKLFIGLFSLGALGLAAASWHAAIRRRRSALFLARVRRHYAT